METTPNRPEREPVAGESIGEPAAIGEPAREETPSEAVEREFDKGEGGAPGDAPISERLSDESSLSRLTDSGVTVHRIRRG